MNDTFPPDNYIPTESAVPGIDVYKPAPVDEEHREVVDFRCPQCDGVTAYSAAGGGLTCAYCGYYEPPPQSLAGKGAEEFEFTVETVKQAAHGWGDVRKELACSSCGAHTTLALDMLTHTCPFCGSNQVVQLKAPQDVLRPRFLIPFTVDADACRQATGQWLASSWMTPANLQRLARTADFAPIYVPFWTFDAQASADWRAEVGHTRTKTVTVNGKQQTRTYTEWRWESGHIERFIDDLLVNGSTRLSQVLLERVANYDLEQLVAYRPEFLAGMGAQAYDVTLEEAWASGREQMRQQVKQTCRGQASTSKIRNFSMSLDFSNESWRYILLPLYLATYHYHGQSGRVDGRRRASMKRAAGGDEHRGRGGRRLRSEPGVGAGRAGRAGLGRAAHLCHDWACHRHFYWRDGPRPYRHCLAIQQRPPFDPLLTRSCHLAMIPTFQMAGVCQNFSRRQLLSVILWSPLPTLVTR